MQIDVIGSGSAFATQANTSAMMVTENDQCWLIDCGPTIPRALWQRALPVNTVDVIYFTHIHPDHCAGLAALLNQWNSFGRDKPLTIICQPEQQEMLESLVTLAVWPKMALCFELHWCPTLPSMHWGAWTIQTAPTRHEVSNLAIRISSGDRTLFYSGDGRPTAESIALMENADIAFQECAAFAALPDDDSHGDLPQCAQLSNTLNLAHLCVYHCWDEYIDDIKNFCAAQPCLHVSQDGLTLDLTRDITPQLERQLG
ncbi:MBL fold metallo-hydrolase [Vibrio palustris]|uniref:Ribonuclease Z n=1 Tax=Vibrio palustris TaxID=1918946 RepID=A0A1R4B556_9VIBR|nr:ribonuclease Z [Vibrio palustris]SJL84040.1 Ribonuclease Z [Vibrio palustris]